jgi:hypothetical protein
MNRYEVSIIIGLWRMGNDYATIGWIFSIGTEYVDLIVKEYSAKKH